MTRFNPLLAALAVSLGASATDFDMNFAATLRANGGPHEFAPYYIASLRHGNLTSATGAHLGLKAWRPIDLSKRFSYSFGVEAWASVANSVDYQRFDSNGQKWITNSQTPAPVILQQLWGEVKFRGVFLYAGLRDFRPSLLNERLSSGDLIESGNSRNIPQARIGFIDFQNIPFTNGWVQIQGEVAYAKSTDGDWVKNRFNYYNNHINLGWWYNYKRCYFRTKPSQPFSITVGLQAAAQFNGNVYWYNRQGVNHKTLIKPFKLRSLIDVALMKNDVNYYEGNHLGAWDFQARYRFRNNSELKAYFSWLWEDGSGIGKMTGMDGLWGLEWKAAKTDAPLSGAVLEAIIFTNHGGPIHYTPSDYDQTTLDGHKSQGNDNYYNNQEYNGYAIYGMAIGSPMFISPVYNTNGAVTRFNNNRFWGIHGAVEGQMFPRVRYRAMASFRRFFGSPQIPAITPTHNVSAFFETEWLVSQIPGLKLAAQLGLDYGDSPLGKTFGALVSATYSFNVNFAKKQFNPCVL